MTDAPISSQRLKSFIERVEKLVEERKAIQGDIRDVFGEAKGVGYNVPIMRKVLALRALDAAERAEQECLLDTYMHALETVDRVQARVAAGESVRVVGAAEGVSRMTAHRLSQKRDNDENGTPHDPATGEITETALDIPPQPAPEVEVGTGTVEKMAGLPKPVSGGEVSAEITAASASSPPPTELAAEAERLGLTAVVRDLAAKHDAGPMPAFLRRVPA